tara:strand:+ start:22977 stop:23465 length:489 start_codon:yes stop_codon:yes gene_type:complete
MSSVKVGDKIPLVAHLECPDGVTFYVEAILKRPDRSAVAGSPLDLTDEGVGIFFDNSINMPDEQFITATYIVYEDALKTTVSDKYCSTTSIFTRESSGSGEVIVTNTPDRIVAKVKDERLSAKISDTGPHKVSISDPESKAILRDEQYILKENQNINKIGSN